MKDVPQPNDKQAKDWAIDFTHPGGGRCRETETWWEHECEVSVSPRVLKDQDWRKASRVRMEVVILKG